MHMTETSQWLRSSLENQPSFNWGVNPGVDFSKNDYFKTKTMLAVYCDSVIVYSYNYSLVKVIVLCLLGIVYHLPWLIALETSNFL
jgi:hypothetical protein